MNLRLSEMASALNAEMRGEDLIVSAVESDSRKLAPGSLFVALQGERFDGHAFLSAAQGNGAAAALVSRWVEDSALPQLKVADTLAGLQQLAAWWRQRFSLPVIGLTGSNGKTTSKQMLAAIFATRGPVLATQGNLNNHIGVPLTLLCLRAQHRTAVIEMGANHLREIALLTGIVQPDVGLVTQAGDAHLEGFGSREGVARGKGELYEGLRVGACAIINADDAYAPLWRQFAAHTHISSFGMSPAADVRGSDIRTLDNGSQRFRLHCAQGEVDVSLPLPGRHNVMNALGAAACALAVGLSPQEIAAGLAQLQPPPGRVSRQRTPQNALLIDDSYNANPSSLRAGMELLALQPRRKLLALGNMAELGVDAERLHREAGALARALGIDKLYALGDLAGLAADAFGSGGLRFDTAEALAAALAADLNPNDTVLVKGSRSARMERVVAALLGTAPGAQH